MAKSVELTLKKLEKILKPVEKIFEAVQNFELLEKLPKNKELIELLF